MSCSIHQTVLPRGNGVRVNGVAIARDQIAREVQQHPSRTPAEAWKAAARALAVRELLLQEAKRLEVRAEPIEDPEGRRETAEEAMIRTLVVQRDSHSGSRHRQLPALLRAEPSSVPFAGYL